MDRMQVRSKSLVAVGLAFLLGLGVARRSPAHDGHESGGRPELAGPVNSNTFVMTGGILYEIVLAKDGLKVHPRGPSGSPVDLGGPGVEGAVMFEKIDAAALAEEFVDRVPKAYHLHPSSPGPGRKPTSLDLDMDLSEMAVRGMKVSFQISGMPGSGEDTVDFTVPFVLGNAPAIPAGGLSVTKVGPADRDAVALQKTCPVTGDELGTLGPPLKVARGDRSVFVCCEDCVTKVRADPDKYLGATATSPAAEGGHDHHDHGD